MYSNCLRCGRTLKSTATRQAGYGKVCLGKIQSKMYSSVSTNSFKEMDKKLDKDLEQVQESKKLILSI